MNSVIARAPSVGNKADRVYEALREEFLRGDWPFGKTFSTYELAERFDVSRRPVMDAVLRLEAEGFMEIIPQVGCRIVVPDERRVREQFELAQALEGAAARHAARVREDADVRRLREIHAVAAKIVKARDAEAYRDVNRDFHVALLEISRSGAIAQVALGNWQLREFYIQHYRTAGADPELKRRHGEHAAIIAAIAAGDGEAARAHMEAHLAPERAAALMRSLGDL